VKVALYVVGGVFELFGIMLLAAPDLLPGARRLSEWIRRREQGIENRVRRLLRLQPRVRTHYATFHATVEARGRVSAAVSTGATVVEDQVAFLLRRDGETQQALNVIHDRLTTVEEDSPRRLAELRGEVETHIEERIAVAEAAFRPVRIIGTCALTIGLALSTAGNVV
jgi:hypothetical protein